MKKIIAVLAALGLSSIGLIAVASPANAWAFSASASSACQVVDGVNTGKAVITGSFNNNEPDEPKYVMGVTMNAAGGSAGPRTVNPGASTSFEIVADVPLAAGSAEFVMTWAADKSVHKFTDGYDAVPECKVPPKPTPTPTPTPEPTPPPQPEPPKDFCPDLEGLQWENYDCNTPVVIPTPEPTPTPTETPVVIPTPEPTATPTPTETVTVEVTIPDKPTVPNDVPAGDGSSQNDTGLLWLAFAVALLASVTAIVFALINRKK